MLYNDEIVWWPLAKMIKNRSPKNVFQPYCGCGNVLWRLESNFDIPAAGIEKEQDFYRNRISDKVKFHDMELPWPVKDKEYDLIFTCCLDEMSLIKHASEINRVAIRGFHTVNLDMISIEKAQSILGKNHEVVKIQEVIETEFSLAYNKGVTRLNLGSGMAMFNFGWINVDKRNFSDFAKSNYMIYVAENLSRDAWFNEELADNNVSIIIASHILNFLTDKECRRLLERCWCYLITGGLIRVAVLDFEKFNYNELVRLKYFDDNKIKSVWDKDTLIEAMAATGFSKISIKEFAKSDSNHIRTETFDTYPDYSIYLEARKLTL